MPVVSRKRRLRHYFLLHVGAFEDGPSASVPRNGRQDYAFGILYSNRHRSILVSGFLHVKVRKVVRLEIQGVNKRHSSQAACFFSPGASGLDPTSRMSSIGASYS
jgi:hypothetical protein